MIATGEMPQENIFSRQFKKKGIPQAVKAWLENAFSGFRQEHRIEKIKSQETKEEALRTAALEYFKNTAIIPKPASIIMDLGGSDLVINNPEETARQDQVSWIKMVKWALDEKENPKNFKTRAEALLILGLQNPLETKHKLSIY